MTKWDNACNTLEMFNKYRLMMLLMLLFPEEIFHLNIFHA